MALYTCKNLKTGREVVLEIPMADAPSIGADFEHLGGSYRRLVERDTQLATKSEPALWNWQVDRRSAAAADADFRDRRGTPGFRSRSSAREWAARWKGKGFDVEFDG